MKPQPHAAVIFPAMECRERHGALAIDHKQAGRLQTSLQRMESLWEKRADANGSDRARV